MINNNIHSKRSHNKNSFLNSPATKAFSSPPLSLVAIGTFFPTLKKSVFLSGTPV